MRFFVTLGFLASIIFQSGCLPIDTLSDLSSSQDSSLAAALIQRVKKGSDVIEYLDECSSVDSWQEKPGFINVLAFLDASWGYSHSQATMLRMLQDRLERSGITGIKFFVINSSKPEAALNNVDVEEEREAWDATESGDNRSFLEIEKTREELKRKIDPDIPFIQDTDELKIWEKLSASRDQVIVIDKCGRLSYRVIVPWSILHFPYVKAAILSTYKEQPCGGCDLESTTVTHGTESQTEPLSELVPDNLNINKMKEIVVKKYNLDQTDNTVRKVHHGIGSKDIPENVIQILNGTASVKQEKANSDFNNGTKHGPLMSSEDSTFNESYVGEYSQAQNLTEDNIDDDKEENLVVIGDTLNINESNMKSQNDSNSSSTTIVTETVDILESTTIHSIEEQSSKTSEQRDYLVDNHEPYNSGFTEWASSENTSRYYEEEENLDTDSYSVVSNQSGNGYIDDNSSASEAPEYSASSSGEQTDNHIKKMTPTSGEANADEQSESYDYVMPIKIIMHAPHIHESEKTMKKYEYLVLKFGSPEYHGHLEYDDDFRSNEKTERFENVSEGSNQNESVTSEETDETEFGSGEVGGYEHGKKDQHPGNSHGHKSHRHSKGKHLDIVYGKDESPGFYGEDAEYWRNSGNGDYSGQPQIELPVKMTEPGKDNEMDQSEENIASNGTETSYNDRIIEESTATYHDSETNLEYHISGKILQGKEFSVKKNDSNNEEIENKLLLHYSKLLPWLDYIID